MPRRVLVTRPGPQAARTARRLAELGYAPVILPLTQTVALPADEAPLPDRIDAVAVTSANALRSAPAALLARLAGKPCFAVGEKTARQARSLDFSGGPEPGSTESERHPLSGLLRKPPLPPRGRGKAPTGAAGVSSPLRSGGEVAAKRPERGGDPVHSSSEPWGFASVEHGSGDAEGLADLVIRRLGAGASVVYLCGRVRLSGFETRLIHAGITVHAIETYDTRAIGYGPGELAGAIGMEPVDAVLLYSARAARRFRLLDWPQPIWRLLAQAAYLCLSPRVAEAAGGGSQILVAEEPTEAALLRLLERLEH